MKHLLAAGALSLALTGLAFGQPNAFFINNQVITSPPDMPPQGYATNYINKSTITVSEGRAFNFYDVFNFTNSDEGIMSADIGFLFNHTPDSNGIAGSSASFYNAGTIGGGVGTVPALQAPGAGIVYPLTQIWASNIVNKGLINLSVAGNFYMQGDGMVDLSRGTLNVQGFDYQVSPSSGPPFGMFDNYWGGGNQTRVLGLGNVTWPNVSSTMSAGSNQSGSDTPPALSLRNPAAYIRTNVVADSNQVYQFIYLLNGGTANAKMDADFVPIQTGTSDLYNNEVRWQITTTNYFGKVLTDTFYLTDTLPNASNVTIGSNQITSGGQFLYAPSTYTMSQTVPNAGFSPWPLSIFDASVINATNAFPTNNPRTAPNNTYAIWGLDLLPVTYEPDPLAPNQTYTNVPGRVEITANNLLMSRTVLEGPNYVNLTVTNFLGSPNAQMEFPVSDMNLGNTNGTLVISNLVVPYLSRPTGTIDLWSAAWSNIWTSNQVTTNSMTVGGVTTNTLNTNQETITNRYSVLLVDSSLANTSTVHQEHVTLNATNVLLSDSLVIVSNFYSTAQNFTLTTNAAIPLSSQLELESDAILWSPSFPNLQNFTNWGRVAVGNTTFFSHRASANFPSPGDSPYASYVNHGTNESSGGNFFWASNFVNSGVGGGEAIIFSGSLDFQTLTGTGDLSVQANNAVLANDEMNATAGDMVLNVGNLTMSNTYLNYYHDYIDLSTGSVIAYAGELFLTVTNQLNDGGVPFGNQWFFGYGMVMPIKPVSGDLLGTSIELYSPTNTEVDIIWPGVDMGVTTAGFANNAAVSQLDLFAATSSSAYHFGAAGAQNAIYIEQIYLDGSLDHVTGPALASAFDIDPNMKVYFGHAFNASDNSDASSALTAANSAFVLVPSAPQPFLGSSTPSPKLNISKQASGTPIVSWQAATNAYNILYYAPDPIKGPWSQITNILVGPSSYPISVPTTIQSNAASYYRLGVQPYLTQ